jgi:putative transposase
VARIHRAVGNQRKYFHWQTAVDLARGFDALGFEDLNLKGMKALWGRKVSDLGFSDYLRKQEWICQKTGEGFCPSSTLPADPPGGCPVVGMSKT